MRRGVALLAVPALVVACTRRAPDAPARAAADAGAPPVTVAIAAPADAGPIAAWTDPAAIDGLARSCRFEPTARSHDVLGCTFDFGQSCVSDPCRDENEEDCHGTCTSACSSCADACVGACDACKKSCHDAACDRACAVSCGRCRQDCVTARDRCSTGHCAEVYDACRVRLVTSWLTNACDAVCKPFYQCVTRCQDQAKDLDDCNESCFDKVARARACKPYPMLCDSMTYAPERRALDPKWKANRCDEVCAKIWACAKATCARKSGCGEDIKEFEGCRARTPGAAVCRADSLLCPEPRSE